MSAGRASRRLAAIGLLVAVVLVGAPLLGWPRVLRLPAVLVPALALAVLVTPRGSWRELAQRAQRWQPTARVVWSAALLTGLFLFWYVLTRFRSGEINAIDFTVYYDRPCFRTVQGEPLFVEVSDTPQLSYRSELGDHAYWALLPLCGLYALRATPLWLHALSALAVLAGAVHVLRILQRLGAGGPLAAATAVAYVLNDNTARALNYGFHPEVLYAWLVPAMLDAGLRGARKPFLVATVAAVLVKEDACLPLFAASVGLALHRFREMSASDRWVFLVFPTALALANLALFYGLVVPLLTGGAAPTYSHFWGNYGATPLQALAGMMTSPGPVLLAALTSGAWRTLERHLFLPLVGWRWAVGALPIIVIFGNSANDQVRAFGIYYAIVLVPFWVLGASAGALALAHRITADPDRARLAAAGVVLAGVLLLGSGHRGYSLRPWKEEIAAVPEALASLRDEPVVLVQSGLFPHAGYDARFKLLTPETLADPRHVGAAVLLARRVGAYPFQNRELAGLRERAPIRPLPGGLLAVRLPPEPIGELREPKPKKEGKTRRQRRRLYRL